MDDLSNPYLQQQQSRVTNQINGLENDLQTNPDAYMVQQYNQHKASMTPSDRLQTLQWLHDNKGNTGFKQQDSGVPAPVAPAVAPTAKPVDNYGAGDKFVDFAKSAGSGLAQAATWTGKLINDAYNQGQPTSAMGISPSMMGWAAAHYLKNKFLTSTASEDAKAQAFHDWTQSQLDKVGKATDYAPKSIAGDLTKGTAQFLPMFLGSMEAAPAIVGSKIASGVLSAGVAGGTSFDPHEARLSNMLADYGKQSGLTSPILDTLTALKANPNDSDAVGRLKNAGEQAGLGFLTEGLLHAVTGYAGKLMGKGTDPAKAFQKSSEEVFKPAEAGKPVEGVQPQATPEVTPTATPDVAPQALHDAHYQDYVNSVVDRHGELNGSVDNLSAEHDALVKGNANSVFDALDAQKNAEMDSMAQAGNGITEGGTRIPWSPEIAQAIDDKGMFSHANALQKALIEKGLANPADASEVAQQLAAKGFQSVQHTVTTKELEAIPKTQSATGKTIEIPKAEPEAPKADTTAQPAKTGKGKGKAKVVEEAPVEDKANPLVDGKTPSELSKAADDLMKDPAKESWGDYTHHELEVLTHSTDPETASTAKTFSDKLGVALGQEGIKASVGAGAGALSTAGGAMASDDPNAPQEDSHLFRNMAIGAGIAVGGSKLLKVFAKDPVAKALSEAPSIAPKVESRLVDASGKPIAPKVEPSITPEHITSIVDTMRSGATRNDLAKEVAQHLNLDHLDHDTDVRDFFTNVSDKLTDAFEQAKMGTQSFASIQNMADTYGASLESMKTIYGDTKDLASRMLAQRVMVDAMSFKSVDMAKAIDVAERSGNLSALDLETKILELRKQAMLTSQMQVLYKGAQTEVARAMSAMRIQATNDAAIVREVGSMLDDLGGKATNMDFVRKLGSLGDDLDKANKMLNRGAMARTMGATLEYYVNALLSGTSLGVHLVGNVIRSTWGLVDHGVASGIGNARQAFSKFAGVPDGTWLANPDKAYLGEVGASVSGMAKGLMDSIHVTKAGLDYIGEATGKALTGDIAGAKQTLADNSGEFGSGWQTAATGNHVTMDKMTGSPIDYNSGNQFTGANLGGAVPTSIKNVVPDSISDVLSKGTDLIGQVVRLPTRALVTADDIFKSIHRGSSLQAQAYRIATNEGHVGEAFNSRVADLVSNPTLQMSQQAIEDMKVNTFAGDLGAFGKAANNMVNAATYADIPLGRIIVPFMKIPSNILKFSFEHTPLAAVSGQLKADIMAGGARGDLALAKITTGSMLFATAASLASAGYLTGGGTTMHKYADGTDIPDKELQKGLGTGWIPYSIHHNGKYVQFSRTDPMGFFLGMGADFADIMGHLDDPNSQHLAAAAVTAISSNIVSKTYLANLIKTLDAVTHPDTTHAANYINNMAASFVPSVVGRFNAAEIDPNMHVASSMIEAMKAKIPSLSKSLPTDNNLFGEPITYNQGLGSDIASPIQVSHDNPDPVVNELAKMNVHLTQPSKSIGKLQLNSQDYSRLQQLTGKEVKLNGKNFKETLSNMMSDPSWSSRSDSQQIAGQEFDGSKEALVKYVHSRFKQAGVQALLHENPALMKQHQVLNQDVGLARMGKPVIQTQPQ